MSKNQPTVDDEQNEPVEQARPELPQEPEDMIAKLEENLALEKDKYLRLIAEFENYKKRNLRERLELLKSAGEDVIIAVLPVLDDFERAAKAGSLQEGVQLIYNKLVTILSQKGLKPMEAIGKDFDADLHDALSNIKAGEEMKNKVVEEIEKGYYLNDKVIRHAKVIVGN